MRKVISWLIESFEGKDGRASGRALTCFYFNVLSGYMIVNNKVTNNATLYALIALLVTGAIYYGLITVQHIIEFKNGKANSNSSFNDMSNFMRDEESSESKGNN